MQKAEANINKIIEKYHHSHTDLLPILEEIVELNGYLTEEMMRDTAKKLSMSPNEVYAVATFYSFINIKPTGRYVIRVCKTISCQLSDKNEIIKAIKDELNIKVGLTTKDKLFTLNTTDCIGMCDKGPSMLINDEVYHSLNPEKVVSIIREYKNL